MILAETSMAQGFSCVLLPRRYPAQMLAYQLLLSRRRAGSACGSATSSRFHLHENTCELILRRAPHRIGLDMAPEFSSGHVCGRFKQW